MASNIKKKTRPTKTPTSTVSKIPTTPKLKTDPKKKKEKKKKTSLRWSWHATTESPDAKKILHTPRPRQKSLRPPPSKGVRLKIGQKWVNTSMKNWKPAIQTKRGGRKTRKKRKQKTRKRRRRRKRHKTKK